MCAVNHAGDFDGFFGDAINNDERKRRQDEFPRTLQAPQPASIRKRSQRIDGLKDNFGDALRSGSIVSKNVFDNSGEILEGGGGLTNLHLGMKQLVDPCAHVFVSYELPAVELGQASLSFLAEPGVVVDVMLDKLPNILLRVAVVFRCGMRELRQELGTEVDFHSIKARRCTYWCQAFKAS